MPVILNIDTSTATCSAALTAEGQILCNRVETRGRNHAALLSQFIKDCLDHARAHEIQLDAVAVSMGPGSYTGLRIGLSEAKGLAYALNIPLIGIDTLKIMAVGVMFGQPELPDDVAFLPMIDARRMEVFAAAYDIALTPLMEPRPLILTEETDMAALDSAIGSHHVLFFGDGASKAQEIMQGRAKATFIPDVTPLASDMLALAEQAYARREFLDLAYSTPRYLKEFQATRPKSRI